MGYWLALGTGLEDGVPGQEQAGPTVRPRRCPPTTLADDAD